MKAKLLSGKYYRRENGGLVKYLAGDILEVSPAESRTLNVEKHVPVQRTRVEKPVVSQTVVDIPTVDRTPVVDPPSKTLHEMTGEDLLEKYLVRQKGSWFILNDGSKYQGRQVAINAAKLLEEEK